MASWLDRALSSQAMRSDSASGLCVPLLPWTLSTTPTSRGAFLRSRVRARLASGLMAKHGGYDLSIGGLSAIHTFGWLRGWVHAAEPGRSVVDRKRAVRLPSLSPPLRQLQRLWEDVEG